MKLNKVDFTIISSGALVIREIISDARNLDIAVTKEGHNKLNKKKKEMVSTQLMIK